MEQNIVVVKYIAEVTQLIVDIREKQYQEEVRAVDIPLGRFPISSKSFSHFFFYHLYSNYGPMEILNTYP